MTELTPSDLLKQSHLKLENIFLGGPYEAQRFETRPGNGWLRKGVMTHRLKDAEYSPMIDFTWFEVKAGQTYMPGADALIANPQYQLRTPHVFGIKGGKRDSYWTSLCICKYPGAHHDTMQIKDRDWNRDALMCFEHVRTDTMTREEWLPIFREIIRQEIAAGGGMNKIDPRTLGTNFYANEFRIGFGHHGTDDGKAMAEYMKMNGHKYAVDMQAAKEHHPKTGNVTDLFGFQKRCWNADG